MKMNLQLSSPESLVPFAWIFLPIVAFISTLVIIIKLYVKVIKGDVKKNV